MQLSIFSSAELPASRSVSPDSERDWLIRVATSRLRILPLLTAIGPSGWSGRTSPACCHQAEDETLEPSSEGWGNSGMGGPTESWTLSKRVFVVANLGGWQRAAAVLFDSASLRGDSAPRREAGQGVAGTFTERADRGGGNSEGQRLTPEIAGVLGSRMNGGRTTDLDGHGAYIPEIVGTLTRRRTHGGGLTDKTPSADASLPSLANPLTARMGKGINTTCDEGQTLIPRGGSFDAPMAIRTANTNANGHGLSGGVAHTLDQAQGQAIAFRTNQTGALDTDGHTIGILKEDYAGAYEADASSVLSELRKKVGAEAVAEWGSRILDSLQSPEVLRSWLHGESLRRTASDFRSFVDDRPLPRQEGSAAATLRKVWQEGPDGRSSQGRGLAKQLAQQLGKALPELPHARASEASTMQVRRLTPRECEKLQGFSPDYTLIPYRGKPAADGPRYKALGNSMAVPCMRWIGERIALVNAIAKEVAA